VKNHRHGRHHRAVPPPTILLPSPTIAKPERLLNRQLAHISRVRKSAPSAAPKYTSEDAGPNEPDPRPYRMSHAFADAEECEHAKSWEILSLVNTAVFAGMDPVCLPVVSKTRSPREPGLRYRS